MPKLVWRVKVITELEPGVATEAEVARIERGEEAGLAELGLRLEEAKRLTAALQAEIVTTQVATAGERPRPCAALVHGSGRWRCRPGRRRRIVPSLIPGRPPCRSS